MTKKAKPLRIKPGDIVLIDTTGASNRGTFPATISEINLNMSGQTIVTYGRLDGVDDSFMHCGISLVKKIIKAAPYVCVPQLRVNIYAGQPFFWNYYQRGGLRMGDFQSLIKKALAGVTHIDLKYDLHPTRPWELYKRASWPGKVETTLPGYGWGKNMTVRWKAFSWWVHQNAHRLILSKSEDLARRAAFKKRADDDLRDAIETDMELESRRMDNEMFGAIEERLPPSEFLGSDY